MTNAPFRPLAGLALACLLAGPAAAQGPVSADRASAVLRDVPVFIPMDSAGTPVVATPPDGGKPVVGLFLRRAGAVSFVSNLRQSRPEIARRVVIRTASLGNALRMLGAGQGVQYTYVPDPAEVTAARQLLASQGKPAEVPGVPVFLAKTSDGGYLTLNLGGRTSVPAFLSLRDLEAFRERYRQSSGPGGRETSVEVSSLEVLIHLMNTSNDPLLAEMDIVPGARAVAEAKP